MTKDDLTRHLDFLSRFDKRMNLSMVPLNTIVYTYGEWAVVAGYEGDEGLVCVCLDGSISYVTRDECEYISPVHTLS